MAEVASHRSENRTGVALVEVCTHTGYVTYVIAHVISNRRRVTRVILGDVVLGLTHQVSAYVSGLGIDTAAHAGEQSLRRSTHTEGQHGGGDSDQVTLGTYQLQQTRFLQHEEPTGDVQQCQTYHRQTHHGTRTERHLQA